MSLAPPANPDGTVPVNSPGFPQGAVAVIDIGSNSIRLVVYDGLSRSPIQIFNEKALCGLGRDLPATQRLNPEGVEQAVQTLRRFRHLLEAMGAVLVDAVATAAVRDALDGPGFLRRVMREAGLSVRVLDGREEGRVSALGVLNAFPGARGVMGDLGGGSLELTALDDGRAGERVTLPLGPFRLLAPKLDRLERDRLIEKQFDSAEWLSAFAGGDLVPVGGAWRSLARAHLGQSAHPLHIIHAYSIPAQEMRDFAQLLSVQSPQSLERISGISRRRAPVLPAAAQVMARLIERLQPTQVVFSAYGLREGLLFERLSDSERAQDPLLTHCRRWASRLGRAAMGPPLEAWTGELFAEPDPWRDRLIRAAAWLQDVGREYHPDYRAEMSCLSVLRMPCVGIDHPGRAFLAAAIFARYAGRSEAVQKHVPLSLLSEAQQQAAQATGLALRLAHALSGGSAALIGQAKLERKRGKLALSLSGDIGALVAEVVERRHNDLAAALNLTATISRRSSYSARASH